MAPYNHSRDVFYAAAGPDVAVEHAAVAVAGDVSNFCAER
jgi:hypothetical protein